MKNRIRTCDDCGLRTCDGCCGLDEAPRNEGEKCAYGLREEAGCDG